MIKKDFLQLTPEIINYQISNLRQIVFEVTDGCNLSCKYCAYGELYFGYDKRESKNLSIDSAIMLINHIVEVWKNTPHRSSDQLVYISFYGGEPLLNMDLIKKIINYVEQLPPIDRKFVYSMTSNGMLLDKYIDYIYDKKIELLISLDGDEQGNSYRVDHQGKNSFSRVYRNIKLIQKKYPDYFEKHVNFNSVLHNKNSVIGTKNFLNKEFNKKGAISALNNTDIREDKKKEFEKMFISNNESIKNDIHTKEDYDNLIEDTFLNIPIIYEIMIFIFCYSKNVYKSYNDFFLDRNKSSFPTGTCLPFSKKIFLTTNNKLMVCERIPQKFVAGNITDGKVTINTEQLSEQYNLYFDKLKKQCQSCYNTSSCQQCIFQIETIDNKIVKCEGFMNEEIYNRKKKDFLNFLSVYPNVYSRLMKDVILK